VARRDVAFVWVVWALLTLAVMVASGRLRLLTLHPHMRSVYAEDHGPLWLLRGWDFRWYSAIANNGYGDPSSYAFFPLWPGLLWIFGHLGAQWPLAMVATTVASALAFLGVSSSSPATSPRTSAIALASMPASFALLLPYADCLALALGSLSVVAAKRRWWSGAAALGFLTALARPNGFLLSLILAGVVSGGARDRRRGIAILAPVAGFIAVNCAFWILSGTPAAFTRAERHWGRGSPTHLFRSLDVPWNIVQATIAIGAAALLWLLWKQRRRYGMSAFLFALAVLGLTIVSGTFAAFARQMLFAIPLVWIAGDLPRAHKRIATAAGVAANVAGILVLPRYFP
jgi:hypothetical protein